MQCPTCRAIYSNGLDVCPRCKTPAHEVYVSEAVSDLPIMETDNGAITENESKQMIEQQSETKSQTSTLIKFPGKKRQEMPEWRKELLEKFKEIQDKRAREAEEANEDGENLSDEVSNEGSLVSAQPCESVKPHLEVVPPAASAPVNPIVAKALERIERANSKPLNTSSNNTAKHKSKSLAVAAANLPVEQEEKEQRLSLIQPQQKAFAASAQTNGRNLTVQMSSRRNGSSGAAKAKALKPLPVEEKFNPVSKPSKLLSQVTIEESSAAAISDSQISKASLAAGIETIKRENTKEVLKEISIQATDILETLSEPHDDLDDISKADLQEQYDDYAAYAPRVVSFIFDIFVVLFASSPFAAVLELGGVDWNNNKILLSVGGIFLIVSFFYLMISVAVIGRTWGMATLSLRVADAETGKQPSFGQATGRAVIFLLSAAAFCLPFLYTLFDAEGRALHDRIAGTIVLREE